MSADDERAEGVREGCYRDDSAGPLRRAICAAHKQSVWACMDALRSELTTAQSKLDGVQHGSVCTKCGWSGVPKCSVFGIRPTVGYWCGRPECGYAVPEPKSATIERLTAENAALRAEIELDDRVLNTRLEEIVALRAAKDGAYDERNRLVALVAAMAISQGWQAGIGTHIDKPGEDWEGDWRTIVYIETPAGQLSWHFHDSQRHLVESLPRYEATYDGHDTPTKYERVAALTALRAAQPDVETIAHMVEVRLRQGGHIGRNCYVEGLAGRVIADELRRQLSGGKV